jgi:hypothetical protein
LSANLFLNALTKVAVRRPRPYTYHAACAADDCYLSFYSGHASAAFTAAVGGAYLFAESAPNRGSRYALWGVELALASATANLRVRGGMHYYSDVVVGAVLGSGLGVLFPVLHGEHYHPDVWEVASAGGGLLVGVTVSELVPRDEPARAARSWTLAPLVLRGAAGAQLLGMF